MLRKATFDQISANKFARAVCTAVVIGSTTIFSGIDGFLIRSARAACGDTAVSGVNWSGCRKRNLIMSDFNFEGSNFERTDLSSSDLRATNLSGTNFQKANLVRSSLMKAKAVKADFQSITASRTDFSFADLSEANFSKAETNRINFQGAKLTNASMSKAEFARAEFKEADISGVSFAFTNLARADFRGAKFDAQPSFEGAYLFQTNFEGLDISSISDLEQWQINLACGDENTVLPSGITKPAHWPCTP